MAETAREVVVMVESQKIGRKMPNLELSWDQIDVLVTDRQISREMLQKIEAQQVEVVLTD